jgi:hypothetical protein
LPTRSRCLSRMEDRTVAGRELHQPVFNTGSQVKLLAMAAHDMKTGLYEHASNSDARTTCTAPHPNLRNAAVSTEIIGYGFSMRKEGYAESTIERYVRLLRPLSGYADMKDSEAVKVALTQTGWSEATKETACCAYALYAKQHGFAFVPPRNRRVEKLPFIPLNRKSSSS